MAFHGKTVIISGGASGMGRLHAINLANDGATVAIIDLNEDGLEETSSNNKNILPFKCDVTDISQVKETISKIVARIGVPDRLINCAAIMPGGLLLESSADSINQIMLVNYCGMVNVCQTVVPKMLERNQGDVIIYGSTAGIIPVGKFGGYGATKSANNFYAKILMLENAKSKLRFQLVCPPAVDTPLIDQVKEKGPDFLKDIQTTRKNLIAPEFVIASVEKCLEKGKKINYPGFMGKLATLLYRISPSLVIKLVGK